MTTTVMPTNYPPVQEELQAVQERPTFVDVLDLVALPSAVVCGCIFVATTFSRWDARFLEADAIVIVGELVMLAVMDTGPDEHINWQALDHLNPITVRLLGYEERVVIEVWDSATEPPQPTEHRGQGEEPTGLELVDLLTERWGSSRTPNGRVMWAELAVHRPALNGLPIRQGRHTIQPASPLPDDHPSRDDELLRRVRDGINRL